MNAHTAIPNPTRAQVHLGATRLREFVADTKADELRRSVWSVDVFDASGSPMFTSAFCHNAGASENEAKAWAAQTYWPCRMSNGAFVPWARITRLADDRLPADAEMIAGEAALFQGLPNRGDFS